MKPNILLWHEVYKKMGKENGKGEAVYFVPFPFVSYQLPSVLTDGLVAINIRALAKLFFILASYSAFTFTEALCEAYSGA